MCGILGILSNKEAAQEIYDGLITLQHRGQDSCGIATFDSRFHVKKGNGLVRDVFDEGDMRRLTGNVGLGHTRYVTIGGATTEDAQPFTTSTPYGMALGHNGNITNYVELREELKKKYHRQINSECDADLILHVLASELQKTGEGNGSFPAKIFRAVNGTMKRLKGSYSAVSVISDYGLLAFRDPYGLRPLVMGARKKSFKEEFIFASENTMFNALDFKYIGDVAAGEAVFVDFKTREVSRKIINQKGRHLCIFEHVYFSRTDSLLDGISVYRARLRLGKFLAKRIQKDHSDLKIDLVVPAPSTANTAALTLAYHLGVRYCEGLVKNHFVGRTFIMPGQEIRKKSIKQKLSPLGIEIRNKNVLIVDDSIVRGNTSREMIDLVRKAGAKKVFLAVTSPPLRWPCVYGIDMPVKKDFIASGQTVEQIRKQIGADALIYQTLGDMIAAVTRRGKYVEDPCAACFTGKYPTKDVTEKVLKQIEQDRLAAYKQFNLLEEAKGVKEEKAIF